MPQSVGQTPITTPSVEKQLAEVYAIVAELRAVTERLHEKMETLMQPPVDGDASDD